MESAGSIDRDPCAHHVGVRRYAKRFHEKNENIVPREKSPFRPVSRLEGKKRKRLLEISMVKGNRPSERRGRRCERARVTGLCLSRAVAVRGNRNHLLNESS